MVDTNCNPDPIDHPIPANDDAIRAIRLLTGKIADAVIEGRQERESAQADLEEGEAGEGDDDQTEKAVVGLDFVPREWNEDGRAAEASDGQPASAGIDEQAISAPGASGETEPAAVASQVDGGSSADAEPEAGAPTAEVPQADREPASRGRRRAASE
jgi:hypothetical protein